MPIGLGSACERGRATQRERQSASTRSRLHTPMLTLPGALLGWPEQHGPEAPPLNSDTDARSCACVRACRAATDTRVARHLHAWSAGAAHNRFYLLPHRTQHTRKTGLLIILKHALTSLLHSHSMVVGCQGGGWKSLF